MSLWCRAKSPLSMHLIQCWILTTEIDHCNNFVSLCKMLLSSLGCELMIYLHCGSLKYIYVYIGTFSFCLTNYIIVNYSSNQLMMRISIFLLNIVPTVAWTSTTNIRVLFYWFQFCQFLLCDVYFCILSANDKFLHWKVLISEDIKLSNYLKAMFF